MTDVIKIDNDTPIDYMSVLVNPIAKRLVNGRDHNLAVMHGRPGIGKTGSAITICCGVTPDFDPDRDIVFDVGACAQRMKISKFGDSIVFDEAGEAIGSRSAMNKKQRNLMALFQAARAKGLNIWHTVPGRGMVDLQLRQLMHFDAKAMTRNDEERTVAFRLMENTFHMDWRTGMPIFRYPVVMKNSSFYRVKTIKIPHPEIKIWHRYLKRKHENLERIVSNVLPEIRAEENKTSIDQELEPYIQKILGDISSYVSGKYKDRISADKIRYEHPEVSQDIARRVAFLVQKRRKSHVGQ